MSARIIRAALCALPLALTACDPPDVARALEKDGAARLGTYGPFEVWKIVVKGSTVYVVPNATTHWASGKTRQHAASPGMRRSEPPFEPLTEAPQQRTPLEPEAIAALSKLSADERRRLGLPDPADPFITGLAKLTAEEREALGLGR